MPRSQLDPAIADRVGKFWVDKGHALGAKEPSRRSLYGRYVAEVGHELSWGSFSTVAKRLEEAAPKEPFPAAPWRPWIDPEESAADTAFLLRINAAMLAEQGRRLYDLEARWGRRLRPALEGVPPLGQSRLVMHYALRELRAYYLREEIYTEDLDNLLAYRPWFEGNQEAYHFALVSGLAPYPGLDPFNTFRNAPVPPEWEEWVQREGLSQTFQHTWMLPLYCTLVPCGTPIPSIQKYPEYAEILGRVVKFWGLPREKDQSAQGNQDAEEQDADGQEHLSQEQLVRN
jgi:hypothetical protein